MNKDIVWLIIDSPIERAIDGEDVAEQLKKAIQLHKTMFGIGR